MLHETLSDPTLQHSASYYMEMQVKQCECPDRAIDACRRKHGLKKGSSPPNVRDTWQADDVHLALWRNVHMSLVGGNPNCLGCALTGTPIEH